MKIGSVDLEKRFDNILYGKNYTKNMNKFEKNKYYLSFLPKLVVKIVEN